jgi:trk system potassium uptake protein TrkH
MLIVLGGIGFIPVVTIMRRRSFTRLPLDNKLILVTTGGLLIAGALFTAADEWNNDRTLGKLDPIERPLVALFQSTSARTAGFSAIDMSGLHDQTKLATIGLMFVGAAAGSTGGGLKVGAFALLFAVMVATIRGSEEVSAFRRRIPPLVIQQATTLALYHVALLFGFTLALTLAANQPFIDLLFEAQSAISTVGLSTAGTVNLGSGAHLVLILAMLAGRFSPVMLVLYMTRPRRKVAYHHPVDSVRLS